LCSDQVNSPPGFVICNITPPRCDITPEPTLSPQEIKEADRKQRIRAFVPAYNLQTGDKIKLQGDFTATEASWKGVSKTGNALGRLRGTYGVNNPTVVVEYGSFENAVNKVEEVRSAAYFDLQTGKLKQLIKFD